MCNCEKSAQTTAEIISDAIADRDYVQKVRDINDKAFRESGKKRKAYVLTFGCQQNEADSERVAGMANSMGYDIVKAPENADLIVVNTCAIREHAEQKALSIIGQFKHLKTKNPDLVISVCGCMVAQEHRQNDIKFKYPYVNFIFGTTALHKFPELLYKNLVKGKRIYYNEEAGEMAEWMPVVRNSDYKAWVSIMYGCNNFCSYCIVPYVRGRERSRNPENIIAEVRQLVKEGYKDITLLGQNVNSYGKDCNFDCDFADLLDRIAKIEGDYTLRFMTSHPKDATKKLIDVMAANKRIARHFHLPMQSGSNLVLKRMNRKYDTGKYMETVNYIREKMPDCVITSDIIVGFPGESEEDFEGTLNMLEKVEFDMIYSFIYSPRKGTPAAKMENQIPREVQNNRFDRLLKLQNDISLKKNLPSVGQTMRVLCDGESKNDSSMYNGRTEGNKIVFFKGNPEDKGNFVNIKIDRAETFALYGEKV